MLQSSVMPQRRSQTALRHSVCRVRLPQHSMVLIVHCYRREGVPILRTRPVSNVFQLRSMANLKHWRCTSQRRTLPPPTAYSSQDARRACDARPSSAAHGSPTIVGTAEPKMPTMGWARPAMCAYRSLSTQFLDQLNKPESRWTQLIQLDCNAANISVDNLEHLAADRQHSDN